MSDIDTIPDHRLVVAINALTASLEDGRYPEDFPVLAKELISATREYRNRVDALIDRLTDEDKPRFS